MKTQILLLLALLIYCCDDSTNAPLDCNGVSGGLAVMDACGLCDGPGILNGECNCQGDILDSCEICGGNGCYNKDCSEYPSDLFNCSGECLFNLDECGICNGGGITPGTCDCDGNIYDCDNVCGGNSFNTECGECSGEGADNYTDCTDCIGEGTSCCSESLIPLNTFSINASGQLLYRSDSDIRGFQFDLDTSGNIEIHQMQGGILAFEDYQFTLSNSSNTIIAVSLTGESIPAGCGILSNIAFTGNFTGVVIDPEGCTENCVGPFWSDENADPLSITYHPWR